MIKLAFSNPLYLWYLLSIPLLIVTHFFFLRRTKGKAIKFANFTALQRVSSEKIFIGNYLVLVIRVLILSCLIFAIADTTLWYEGLANKNTYVIAIDVSASMSAQDMKPTRLDIAKQHALDFLDTLRSNADIGVVSFAGVPFIAQVPTQDRGLVRDALSQITIINAGGTDIPGAIITATNLLATAPEGKTLILITDGSTTAGYLDNDPIGTSSRYAAQNNVRVFTIGIGQLGGPIGYLPEYYNITSIYEGEDLEYISNHTNGKYYHATNESHVHEAFTQFSQDSRTAWLKLPLGPILLLAGLLLLFFEWGLINTRFKRVP